MTLTEAVRCVAHCVTFAGLPRGAAPVRVIGAIPNGPAWRCHAILGSGSANHAPASRSNQRLWYVRSRGNQCSTRSSSGARVITPTGPEDCRALIMSFFPRSAVHNPVSARTVMHIERGQQYISAAALLPAVYPLAVSANARSQAQARMHVLPINAFTSTAPPANLADDGKFLCALPH